MFIMKKNVPKINKRYWLLLIVVACGVVILDFFIGNVYTLKYDRATAKAKSGGVVNKIASVADSIINTSEVLDKVAYDSKMLDLANCPFVTIKATTTVKTATSTQVITIASSTRSKCAWPVKNAPYPKPGAILPFKRVVAYYGNLYSVKMGVLGEYPEAEMLRRLNEEVKKWEQADPKTPVVPALHYIAVTAQASAGADGKYRLRMPDKEIDKVLAMAQKINAIVFIDLQVGLSDLRAELPVYEKYLKMPNVHLGIDPEFSMKSGKKPGTVIGTYDAADVNYAAQYLAKLVKDNNLPPKILVVHRFTQPMLTNAHLIKPLPEVQIVINMDGWGTKERKLDSYKNFVAKEPVQFTGFKLFYKNDYRQAGSKMMTPAELLKLSPQPIYIQYQ
jgi:hypothetical protein